MKHTVTAFVFMELGYALNADGTPNYYKEKVWAPTVWKCRVDDKDDCLFIGAQQVVIDVPDDFNPIPHQVAALQAEKAATLDAYQRSVASINERLSKLLAITHNA